MYIDVHPLVMLTHKQLDGDDAVVYDGQRATFLCVIVADHEVILINWSSEQYIGTGGDVLQLTSADSEGHTTNNTRHPTTVAALISTYPRSRDRLRVITVVSEL